jgi:hypothetical protein
MRRTLCLTCDEIRPDGGAIIRRMHGETPGAPYLNDLAEEARAIIERVGRPIAVFEQVTPSAFDALYASAGPNDTPSPLPGIVGRAVGVALFAATLGPEVEAAICERLRRGHAAEACMLDAFTAAASERLAQVTADQFADAIGAGDAPAFPYMPGYCGWHISALPVVLDRLRPEEIGTLLTGSNLLQPLSSIAGVIVAAPPHVHRVAETYPCCTNCSTRRCLYRVSATHHAA